MRSYRPKPPPEDPKQIAAFLRTETASIAEAANRADDRVALTYLAVAPSKPQDGIYLSAANVLGANRGAYRYDSTTGLYTFIA